MIKLKSNRSKKKRKTLFRFPFLLLLPGSVFLILLILFPSLKALWLSMTDKMVGFPSHFIGIKNYTTLLKETVFRRTFFNTMIYTFCSVMLKIILGLSMALIVDGLYRTRNLVRGILLLPWIQPTIVTAVAWLWIFDPTFGLLNLLLIKFGLITTPIGWLSNQNSAMAAVILVNVWRGFPFFGVMFLAGIRAIPEQLYEAARIDGASSSQQLRHITLPMLKGVFLVTTFLSAIWTFYDFQIVWILTRGGPGGTTHILATYTYELGFNGLRLGLASAIPMLSLPVLSIGIYILSKHILRYEVR